MDFKFFGIRYPDDEGSFASGTMMLGTQSKINLSTSKGNTFIGLGSGNQRIAGETGSTGCVANTFIGTGAGHSDISGSYNTFIGRSSGVMNETGHHNTYIGSYSGKNNIFGNYNTYLGSDSGYLASGSYNILIGHDAGFNQEGDGNIIIGTSTHSKSNLIIGNNNTFETNNNLIYGSNNEINDNSNVICIGNNNIINESNLVYIGNNDSKYIEANSGIYIPADYEKIKVLGKTNLGLDFISNLNPVSYEFNDRKYEGFIAQEINNFCGVINNKIDYTAFIAPLVKSIQELKSKVEELETRFNSVELEEKSVELEEKSAEPKRKRNKRK